MQYKNKRRLLDLEIHYQTRNQLFVFDKIADELIGSKSDYHLIINWNNKLNHKNVICNQRTYALLTPTKNELVVFIQTNSKKELQ